MIKTLEVSLGEVRGFNIAGTDPIVGEKLAASGYYYDPLTGNKYYYDVNLDKWYSVTASGLFVALTTYMSPAPKQISLVPGNKLLVTISFKYSGPAVTGVTGYYCIGVYGVGFDEMIVGQTTFNLPLTSTPPAIPNVTNSYTFTIPSSIEPSWNDIYVKIFGGSPSIAGQTTTPYIFGYIDALVIAGLTPVITEFKILDFVKA